MSIYDPGAKAPMYSPLWNTEALHLPRDRATINAWCRSFYALNPDVNRLINQHALLLSSVFDIKKCKSIKINKFCFDQMEKLNIPTILENIIIEYFVIGEVFLYAELDEQHGMFSRLLIQNPDYILVKKSITDSNDKYYLRPDENLRRICFSNEPKDIVVRNLLSENIVETVKNRENILLNNFYLTHFCHKTSPYEIRGTSMLVPLFDELKDGYTDMLKIRQTLFDITSYDNGNIAKDVLMTRYLFLIDKIENWINNKILAAAYKIQGFGTHSTRSKLPQVMFDRNKLREAVMSSSNQ